MDNRETPKFKKIGFEEFKNLNTEEKIMEVSGSIIPPSGKSREEILNEIFTKTIQSKPAKTFRISTIQKSAAAILILILSVYIVNNYLIYKYVKTQYADQKEVKLPDGTLVVLNAGSNISWNTLSFKKKRKINLEGEAFFNVKKGDEFIIFTNNGTVEILGTELNIYVRKSEFKVSCITGKVKVSANNKEEIISPGEWVILKNSDLIKHKSQSIEKSISWKDGIIHFEDTKLVTIFDELERQFDIRIVFKGNSERLATIDFLNDNLAKALDVICIPMELNYEIKKQEISIYQKE